MLIHEGPDFVYEFLHGRTLRAVELDGLLDEDECEVLILDEVNLATSFGLLDPAEVLDVLKSRKSGIEVVLTGRNAPREFMRYADYVSYVDDRKHPHKKGASARRGVEW